MRSFWFGKDLPSEFTDPIVRDNLSFNGQLHFRCSTCNEIIWGEITFGKFVLENGGGFPCPHCRGQNLILIKFEAIESRVCARCGEQCFSRPEQGFVCTVCDAHQFVVTETLIHPPYPTQLFALFGRTEPFGKSSSDDVNFLIEYVKALRMSPQFHQTCIHLVAFIESIFEHLYRRSSEASDFLNVASGLMRQVYKETNNPDAAYLSIAIMIEGRDLETNPIQRAVYGLNINQNLYSVLARGHDELLSPRFNFNLKEYGVWLSRQTLADFDALDESALAQLRAQQKWLLGDILKAGNPSEAEIDEALQWFAAALKDPALPKQMAAYVEESALTAKAKRRNLTAEQRIPIDADLAEIKEVTLNHTNDLQRIKSLGDLLSGRSRTVGGQDRRDFALRCLGEALIYVAANDPKNVLRHAGSLLSQLAAGFAAERFSTGAPLEGISGVEAFRSLAIEHGNVVARLGHHVHRLEVQLKTKALLSGEAEDPIAVAKGMLSQHQESLERNVRKLLEGRDGRFIVWFDIWNGTLLMAKIRLNNNKLDVATEIRNLQITEVRKAFNLPMPDAPPSRLRSRQVEIALTSGWKMFESTFATEPIDRSAIFIGPSILSNWPIDAAEMTQRANGHNMRPMMFSPTIGVASATRKNLATQTNPKVLLVSYGGSDLVGTRQEIEDIKNIYGLSVTVLDGRSVSKSEVLQALSQPFEIIHFCGHGEFDYLEPMQSRIYFHNRKGSDGAVTADEILNLGSIGQHPIVVLSACTSALVLPNGSNNFLGLAGALLRTGATSIVGARWPIADMTGAAFSKYFHTGFANGDSVEEAVSFAKKELRSDRIDEWSAFMSIGG